ncbi:two-component system regulatory protein YycI [Tissierella sp. MB52-C2]|uniref:two-component system regulatory protein YycI n=1 Tax=Tissierella sp. MB52-C2 TaxID=3070999 RepID=UPI00280B5893|nr:two-component system regulatory protein YycI [Tissierella sp. MB52-C2]WMM24757.1 two-component system regulatory protein YycI [Tissierella sp. MB52-C2]
MDWSKAKTILIVAFIVTNMLLGFVLLSSERQTETTIKEGFIEDVTQILKDKNIFLDTEISKEIPSLNTLIVEYEFVDSSKINNTFFQGQGIIESDEQSLTEIVHKDEKILITNKKTLVYENKSNTENYKDLDEEKAKNIALEFLQERRYNISDMELSYILLKDDSYYLEFSKSYKDRYLEKSYTNIEVNKTGVKKLERIWLNVLEERDTLIYIGTAPKSILSLLSMKEVYGKTIKDISLCYYFEPTDHNDYVKDLKEAKKGKTMPAWRVLFNDGYKVIIDNYNN